MKRSVAGSVPDRASVHTRNAAFEAVSVPGQDRLLKRSESGLNTFIGAEL